MKRFLTHLLMGLGLAAVCAGCAKPAAPLKSLAGDEGELYLYVEPFPRDAGRLAFSLASVSAVRADGVEIPLTVKVADYSTQLRRQRLMAVGVVPAGEYRGVSFLVKKATLRSEDGDSALLVSEKPDRNDFAFTIGKKGATVISLTLQHREAIKGGFHFFPAFAMAIPPNPLPTLTGYVTNAGDDTVTVFDKREGKVAKVVETGRNPFGIAIDQAQMKAYVALTGDDAVEVMDLMENDVVSRLHLRSGDAPLEIALTPDGRTLITVNSGSNTVSFLDPVSQVELARLTVGNSPVSILLDRAGRRAYVFNSLSNTVSVIDIANRSITGSIATESSPLRGQFNRKGDLLYICYAMSPTVTVMDPLSFTPVKRFQAGMGISTIKVNPFNDLLYVGKRFDGTFDIYDPFSFIPGDFLQTAGGVGAVAVDGDEKNLAVVHPAEGTVQLINLISKKEAALMDVGVNPARVSMFGER